MCASGKIRHCHIAEPDLMSSESCSNDVRDISCLQPRFRQRLLVRALGNLGQLEARSVHRTADNLVLIAQNQRLRVSRTDIDANRECHTSTPSLSTGARLAIMWSSANRAAPNAPMKCESSLTLIFNPSPRLSASIMPTLRATPPVNVTSSSMPTLRNRPIERPAIE